MRALSRCLLLVFLSPVASFAQEASDVARVAEDIRYLASDDLEGRGPGSPGLEQAAAHIERAFRQAGLRGGAEDGDFRQRFQVTTGIRVRPEKNRLVLHGPHQRTIVCRIEKEFQPLALGAAGDVRAEVVFVGYGIQAPKPQGYDDYADVDVKGKVVLMIRREPQQDDPDSRFDGKKTTPHAGLARKLRLAKQRGAAAVLLANDPFTTNKEGQDVLAQPAAFGTRQDAIPMVHLSQSVVDRLLEVSPLADGEARLRDWKSVEQAIDADLQPSSQPLAGWSAELTCDFEAIQVEVANVVGVLDGEGPRAKETVVLGAHYDHIGWGEFGSRRRGVRAIHNGADDNASGTAAIMELARRFAARPSRPPRRMVFIAFSAEEKGLVGSRYYIEHPLFALEDTVAMLNYDMIGRMRSDELMIHGARSAAEFPDWIDQASADLGLQLKAVPRTMANGDHFGFYQRNIPAVHFFTGLTDEYHTPDDDFETLNLAGVARTVDFSERMLDRILESPERPKFVKTPNPSRPSAGVAYLGITPDYASGTQGVRISSVAEGSPAGKAGLQKGDEIIGFGGAEIRDMASLVGGLRSNRPGDRVKVDVRRGDGTVSCNVTLGRTPGG